MPSAPLPRTSIAVVVAIGLALSCTASIGPRAAPEEATKGRRRPRRSFQLRSAGGQQHPSRLEPVAHAFAPCLRAPVPFSPKARDIDLEQLLRACDGALSSFPCPSVPAAHPPRYRADFLALQLAMGGAMAAPARYFEANLRAVRTARDAHRRGRWAGPVTMRALLEAEAASGAHGRGGLLKDPSAAMGLLWIRRSIAFNAALFPSHLVSSQRRARPTTFRLTPRNLLPREAGPHSSPPLCRRSSPPSPRARSGTRQRLAAPASRHTPRSSSRTMDGRCGASIASARHSARRHRPPAHRETGVSTRRPPARHAAAAGLSRAARRQRERRGRPGGGRGHARASRGAKWTPVRTAQWRHPGHASCLCA